MEQINLNLIPGRALPVCHVSQYDVGRKIRCNLFEGDQVFALATGDTAEVHVRKPDDTVVTASLTIVNAQTYLDITTTQQMDAVAGSNLCEIQLIRSGNTLGTLNFIMEVEADPMDGGVQSSSVIRDLQAQVDAATAAAIAAESGYLLKTYKNLQYNTPEAALSDANNAPDNSVVWFQLNSQSSMANLPDFITLSKAGRMFLTTFKYSSFKTQFISNRESSEYLAVRGYNGSVWTAWTEIKKNQNTAYTIPAKCDYSICTIMGGSDTPYISDKIIPAGSYISGIKYYSEERWNNGRLLFVNSTTHEVIYKRVLQSVAGWNYLPLEYVPPVNCVMAFQNVKMKYYHSANFGSEYSFSTGFNSIGGTDYNIGDITSYSTPAFAGEQFILPVQLLINNNPVNYHPDSVKTNKPIVSFIDDDCNIAFYDTWEQIIADKGIRMGLACIAGRVGNPNFPNTMTLAQIKALYNAGHEVYSHSWLHPDFDNDNNPDSLIIEECYKSKDWLFDNSFTRGADVIVYPGGVNPFKISRFTTCNRFYKFGVNAYGGVNPEPGAFMNIWRVNADTATLAELKAQADVAIANNSLMVCMNHSHVMDDDAAAQIAKIEDFIDYLNANSVEILPLREALYKIYGW